MSLLRTSGYSWRRCTLSARIFTPRAHVSVTTRGPYPVSATKMVVSCCAYGCNNRFREQQGLGFYRFPAIPKEGMDLGSEAPRLGSINLLEIMWRPFCISIDSIMVSGRLTRTIVSARL